MSAAELPPQVREVLEDPRRIFRAPEAFRTGTAEANGPEGHHQMESDNLHQPVLLEEVADLLIT
ncbi:MAG TPA: hypothetical protein PL037_09100, partial [Elusimicrobiales bacterium]|nr:hypothetical protein [Elusimicrobiales bacterium]